MLVRFNDLSAYICTLDHSLRVLPYIRSKLNDVTGPSASFPSSPA